MLEPLLRQDFEAVDKNDPVRKVLGWLRGEKRIRPIVVDGKRPYGIPNRSAFMDSRILDQAAMAKYTQPVPVPRVDADRADALAAMSEAYVSYLPVRDERDQTAGYIDALDILVDENGPSAQDVAKPVAILSPLDTLGKAIHDFRGQHTDHLPVVADGKLVGVLPRRSLIGVETNRSISMGTGDQASDSDHLLRDTVADHMEQGMLTLPPNASFEAVVDRLRDGGYAFIVLGNGDDTIKGIVTPEIAVRNVRPMRTAPAGRRGRPGARPYDYPRG